MPVRICNVGKYKTLSEIAPGAHVHMSVEAPVLRGGYVLEGTCFDR